MLQIKPPIKYSGSFFGEMKFYAKIKQLSLLNIFRMTTDRVKVK